MNLYAESSAPLAWLLQQEHGELVAETLAQAELVIASDLTVIECDSSTGSRGRADELQESDAVDRQARLNGASSDGRCWHSTRRSSSARGDRSQRNRSARWMPSISPAR